MEECVMATTSYRGVRKRKWGKWVSEIREPGKKSRIWLGSYEAPEMAAAAYDVAALHLRGRAARINFPELADTLPRPKSSKAEDVQFAAQQAALRFKGQLGNSATEGSSKVVPPRVGLSESQIQAINESPLDSPMQMAEKFVFGFDYCYDDYDQSIMMLNHDHHQNLELSAWEDIHLDSLWS